MIYFPYKVLMEYLKFFILINRHYELNSVPLEKYMLKSKLLIPWNVTFLGKRVIAHVIS